MRNFKFIVLGSLVILLTHCNHEVSSNNVNLTENGCTRGGTFGSRAELCEFVKKEIDGSCVPMLAARYYETNCK